MYERIGTIARVFAGCLTVAASIAVTVGTAAAASAPDDWTDLPLWQEFEAAIGHDLEALRTAVGDARLDAAATCMDEAGWEPTEAVLASFRPVPGSDPIEQTIAAIEADEIAPEFQSDPEFQRAVIECVEQSEQDWPDPLHVIDQQLQQFTNDVSDRATADPEYRAAQDDYEACVAELGYTPESITAETNGLAQQASSIETSYRSGEISADEAIDELRSLQDQRSTVEAHVEPCTDALRRAELAAVATAQRTLLDQQPGLIPGLAATVDDLIERYEPYFRADD